MSALNFFSIIVFLVSMVVSYLVGWDRGYRGCLADQEEARPAPPPDYRQDI